MEGYCNVLALVCSTLTLKLRRVTLVAQIKRLHSAEGDFSRRGGQLMIFFHYAGNLRLNSAVITLYELSNIARVCD